MRISMMQKYDENLNDVDVLSLESLNDADRWV